MSLLNTVIILPQRNNVCVRELHNNFQILSSTFSFAAYTNHCDFMYIEQHSYKGRR